MKNGKENIEGRYQEFLDQREDQNADNLLKEAEEIRKDLHEIKKTDHLLRNMEMNSPSKGFSNRVMLHLDDIKLVKAVNKQGLLITLGVLLVLLISALYVNSVTTTLVQLPEDVSVVGRNFSLDGLGSLFSAGVIMKGLMFSSLILAMLLLDKAVLKPFFEKRNLT